MILCGCASSSHTVISESTAPSTIGDSKNPRVTGRHRITVIGSKIQSRSLSAIRNAAIQEGRRRCEDFVIDNEEYRTGDDPTSQMAGIRGPWIEMDIVCADVPREKLRGSALLVIDEESRTLPDTSFFDVHAETFPVTFDIAYEAVINVLTSQGDPIYTSDKERGVIVTGRARHGMIGFPSYDQYVVVVDEIAERKAKVTFKLLVHVPNFKMATVADMPPADRKTVYKKAVAFVDKLRGSLK